jgi:peptidyl-prolyl cis-trans isomerase A (cyclophilin A)
MNGTMKRDTGYLALFIMLALTLTIVGCGSGGDTPPANQPADTPAAAEPAEEAPPPATPAQPDTAEERGSPLYDPTHPDMNQTAPDTYRAAFRTSAGEFVVEVHREWAPEGADRFYNLVNNGYYDGTRFFRVLEDFIAQWGIHGDPEISWAWAEATIPDDPVVQGNVRGTITYAMGGPATRTTQVFINYKDNAYLDSSGFAAFGEVVDGMDVVDSLFKGYGESAPQGNGPEQWKIHEEGNAYLERNFPDLDYVIEARILQ